MSATTGTLGTRPLARTCSVYLDARRIGGTLEVARGDDKATLVFADGKLTKLKTSSGVAYLGAVLYEQGIIDSAEHNASLLELSRQNKAHGQILLERGSITAMQLASGLREQALRQLAHVFGFGPDATFAFHEGADFLENYARGAELVPFDVMPAIWRGLRECPPVAHVQDMLVRVAPARMQLGRNSTLERFLFPPDVTDATKLFAEPGTTVAALVASNLVPQRVAELLVYCLAITKQVEMFDAVAPSTRDIMPVSMRQPPPSHIPSVSSMRAPPSRRGRDHTAIAPRRDEATRRRSRCADRRTRDLATAPSGRESRVDPSGHAAPVDPREKPSPRRRAAPSP